MTFEELYQLRNLKREIAEQRERLRELKAAATALSKPAGNMPGASFGGDKLGAVVAEITTLESLIDRQLAEYYHTYLELEMYISNISDSFMRRIIRMRFIDGFSWSKIAMQVGGNQTGDNVRMIAKRFLKNH